MTLYGSTRADAPVAATSGHRSVLLAAASLSALVATFYVLPSSVGTLGGSDKHDVEPIGYPQLPLSGKQPGKISEEQMAENDKNWLTAQGITGQEEWRSLLMQRIPGKQRHQEKMMVKIVGDSVTSGCHCRLTTKSPWEYTYVDRLQAVLGGQEHAYQFSVDAGSGRTATIGGNPKCVSRVPHAFDGGSKNTAWGPGHITADQREGQVETYKATATRDDPDVVMIMLGTNDAFLTWKTCQASYVRDVSLMVKIHQMLPSQPRIVLVNPPTVHQCAAPLSENAQYPYKDSQCAERSASLAEEVPCIIQCVIPNLLRRIAKKMNLAPPIDLSPVLREEIMTPDRIHPLCEGHAAVAARLIDQVFNSSQVQADWQHRQAFLGGQLPAPAPLQAVDQAAIQQAAANARAKAAADAAAAGGTQPVSQQNWQAQQQQQQQQAWEQQKRANQAAQEVARARQAPQPLVSTFNGDPTGDNVYSEDSMADAAAAMNVPSGGGGMSEEEGIQTVTAMEDQKAEVPDGEKSDLVEHHHHHKHHKHHHDDDEDAGMFESDKQSKKQREREKREEEEMQKLKENHVIVQEVDDTSDRR